MNILTKVVNYSFYRITAIDKFNYSSNYGTIYGGVTAMKTETYQLVNGHSNRFWGWGGEDNDMEKR